MDSDFIFEMDADYSHNPRYLPIFLHYAKEFSLVTGSRFLNKASIENRRLWRKIISITTRRFVNRIIGSNFTDITTGYKCFRRDVLEAIDLAQIKSRGYAFQIEMTYLTFKHGFRVREIPILFREREHGYSKISRSVVREAFWLTLKCRAPIFEIIKHLSFLFKDYTEFVNDNKPE